MISGSYDPHCTVGAGIDDEVTRLEAQAALTAEVEFAVMERIGLPGRLLVEIGSGSGAFLTRLADRFPGHDVQGVEIRPDLLDRARERGCLVLQGDAHALPLPDDSCGTVVLRFVLQHLVDPRAAVREAARVLQPGGRLIVIDVDGGMWGCVTPTFPEFRDIYTRFAAAQARDGGDRLVGRKASGWLRDSGLTQVRTEAYSVTNENRPIDDFEIHVGPSRLAPLLARNELGSLDLARATQAWERLRSDPAAWIMLLGIIATGVTPIGTARRDTR
jgi:ubiquinone/menaquinone biosynthesis C-methylase UbiE